MFHLSSVVSVASPSRRNHNRCQSSIAESIWFNNWRFSWHGLWPMASICPFTWLPLTLAVARRQCMRPRGMTAYSRTFNLAKHVLFVLSYEQQTPVFVLCPIWPNTSLSSCCLSSTILLKSFAPLIPLRPNTCLGSWCLSGMQIPWIHLHPLISSAKHMVRVCGWLLFPQYPSAVVCSPFISGLLLSFILALTLFAHLAIFCQHPESLLASIIAMCCRQSFPLPPLPFFGFERPGLIRHASSGQRTIVSPLPRQKPLPLCLTFGLPFGVTTKVEPHARVPSD